MRLGVSATSKVFREHGHVTQNGKYWDKATTSDFDDITDITVVTFASSAAGLGGVGPIFSIMQDDTNDKGFYQYLRALAPQVIGFGVADGSGAVTTMLHTAGSVTYPYTLFGRFGGATGFDDMPILICMVTMFDASATNDSKMWTICSQGNSYMETNVNVANLGTMGTNGAITVGYSDQPLLSALDGINIHKVSVWDSALSMSDLSKLTRRSVTEAESGDFDGNFGIASKHSSYLKLGVAAGNPTWEWNFLDLWQNDAVTNTIPEDIDGVHNLTGTGTPHLGTVIHI